MKNENRKPEDKVPEVPVDTPLQQKLPGGTTTLDSTDPGGEDNGPGLAAKLAASARGLLRRIGKVFTLDSGEEGKEDNGPGLTHEPETSR